MRVAWILEVCFKDNIFSLCFICTMHIICVQDRSNGSIFLSFSKMGEYSSLKSKVFSSCLSKTMSSTNKCPSLSFNITLLKICSSSSRVGKTFFFFWSSRRAVAWSWRNRIGYSHPSWWFWTRVAWPLPAVHSRTTLSHFPRSSKRFSYQRLVKY